MAQKVLVVVLVACLAACSAADREHAFSAVDEAEYLKRFEAQKTGAPKGGGVPQYDPLERVPSATTPQTLPVADVTTIPRPALALAVDYASAMNSSSLIIWHKGRVQHQAFFGETDRRTLINAKALAKPLSTITVGRAIALGYIQSLDQPAADFLTEWRGDELREKITLRHLMGMRSGLLPQAWDAATPDHVAKRAYLHPRHDEVLIQEYPLTDEPGSRYEYSNANSELIAPIIERASGMRYAAFLTQTLLEPLAAKGGTIWVNRPGGTAHAGCCIQLPGETWLKLAVLLLQDGEWDGVQLLPSGFVDQMRTPDALNPHAGLSVYVAGKYVERRGPLHPSIELGRTYHSEPYLSQDLFLFDGNGHQVAYIIPSEDLVILRTGGFPMNGKEWDNSYLPNLIVRSLQDKPSDPS